MQPRLRERKRRAIGYGYWPRVVSGTMKVSIGGAAAMNIHGKNNYRLGSFGEGVRAFDPTERDQAHAGVVAVRSGFEPAHQGERAHGSRLLRTRRTSSSRTRAGSGNAEG